MDDRVVTQQVEPQAIVSIRDCRGRADLPAFIKGAFPELFGYLGMLGVPPSGPPFVIYHAFGPEGIDAEVSVPISDPVASGGRIESRMLPAMTVARTLHVGPYEQLEGAYAALSDWVRSHGLQGAGPVTERYLNGPGDDVPSSEYRTEIDMPVVPLPVAALA